MSGSMLNIMIKLIAIALAILLWFNVVTNKEYEHELMLPVTAVDFPVGLGPVNPLPDSLPVRVLAEGKKLLSGDWKKSGLRIKATRLRRGSNRLEINIETVSLVRPEEITLLDIPGVNSVTFQLDRIDSVYRPIASRVAVVPSPGYMVVSGQATMDLDSVLVVGPRSVVAQIDSIFTEQKILDDKDESINTVVGLEIPEVLPVSLGTDSVNIKIIVDKIEKVRFDNIPVILSADLNRRGAIVDPDRIAIELVGPRELIDSLTQKDFRARIDYKGSLADGYVVPDISIPQNVSVVKITPDSIRILVSP